MANFRKNGVGGPVQLTTGEYHLNVSANITISSPKKSNITVSPSPGGGGFYQAFQFSIYYDPQVVIEPPNLIPIGFIWSVIDHGYSVPSLFLRKFSFVLSPENGLLSRFGLVVQWYLYKNCGRFRLKLSQILQTLPGIFLGRKTSCQLCQASCRTHTHTHTHTHKLPGE